MIIFIVNYHIICRKLYLTIKPSWFPEITIKIIPHLATDAETAMNTKYVSSAQSSKTDSFGPLDRASALGSQGLQSESIYCHFI